MLKLDNSVLNSVLADRLCLCLRRQYTYSTQSQATRFYVRVFVATCFLLIANRTLLGLLRALIAPTFSSSSLESSYMAATNKLLETRNGKYHRPHSLLPMPSRF